jgi:hypothetical protein
VRWLEELIANERTGRPPTVSTPPPPTAGPVPEQPGEPGEPVGPEKE